MQMKTAGRIFPDCMETSSEFAWGGACGAFLGQAFDFFIPSLLQACRVGAFVFPDASCSKIAKSFLTIQLGRAEHIVGVAGQLVSAFTRRCQDLQSGGAFRCSAANYFCQHRLKGPGFLGPVRPGMH